MCFAYDDSHACVYRRGVCLCLLSKNRTMFTKNIESRDGVPTRPGGTILVDE